MTQWLLQDDVLHELKDLRRAGLVPTPEQRAAFDARWSLDEDEGGTAVAPRNLTVVDGIAEIAIEGVLTERADFFISLFSSRMNTPYNAIRQALAVADSDKSVKRAVLKVNSPGGTVDGMFETIAAIQQFSKPITVQAKKALSAAYALAATAGKITAEGKASSFGSVGIAIDLIVFEDEMSITNTDSPDKRPDPRTEEGRAVIQRELDAIQELFVEEIAGGRTRAGRKTSTSQVSAEFGRGATLLAADAKAAGMIDKVTSTARPRLRAVGTEDAPPSAGPSSTTSKIEISAEASATEPKTETTATSGQKETTTMDLNQLKAEHPALYAAAVEEGRKAGESAGHKAGVTEERDRVVAHLTMGQTSGDMKTATEAIEAGTGMTQALQAKYMSAAMNRSDRSARDTETEDATGATENTDNTSASGPDLGDAIVARMEGNPSA